MFEQPTFQEFFACLSAFFADFVINFVIIILVIIGGLVWAKLDGAEFAADLFVYNEKQQQVR